jgi:hypothetical protein
MTDSEHPTPDDLAQVLHLAKKINESFDGHNLAVIGATLGVALGSYIAQDEPEHREATIKMIVNLALKTLRQYEELKTANEQ